MDSSPIIMDTASKFGRNLDSTFPFDDQGFGRLGDIRSQLDNLATRHPEFAEHLLGPPWGDIPLRGTSRHRRRGSGSGNSHQGHPDEDARSQASGSSAASAASGASGVSSHGEPEQMYQHQEVPNKIPQYGLRNTMDIGQHHHNMDNGEKMNREQRSASAPPEDRQQTKEEVNQQDQPPQRNQRFISRVDITPQFNQQSMDKGPMPKSKQKQQEQSTMPTQQQKVSQQQANVRHIPIFVEGRDEPIIPKNIDGPTIPSRQQSPSTFYSTQFDDTPSKFNSPPHFQRPSPLNQHFSHRTRDWSPHFQDSFHDVFDHPNVRKTSQPTQSAPLRQSRQQQHQQPQQHQYDKRPPQNEYNYCNPQMGEFPSQSAVPTQQPEATTVTAASATVQEPKRKIFTPKDPLEKVDLVQREVDSLTEQIKLWNGHSKTDKQYIYLDEMLTRELIKLDDIETEGKDNVRQARKNAIKSIQNSISLLESKVSSAQPINKSQLMDEQSIHENDTKEMEVVSESATSVQEKKAAAIPLPAMTESPIKDSIENNVAPQNQRLTIPTSDEIMQLDESLTLEAEGAPIIESSMEELAQNRSAVIDAPQNTDEQNQISSEVTTIVDKMENNLASKNGKSPKKLRKTKKQTPISTEAIPLPAAEDHYLDVK